MSTLSDVEIDGNDLPQPLTSLVGRAADIVAVASLLASDETRLVTLTGTGGVGKTRLALAIARAVEGGYSSGAAWVPLAPVRDARQVLPAIARALGLRFTGSHPAGDMLATVLHDKHLLLMLDNFEHVLDATADIHQLMERCPRLAILATSRATLHLSGEWVYPVAPLPLPDVDELAAGDAIMQNEACLLFAQRAQAFDPEFVLDERNALAVAEICVRVDGLPLAIEMAAAWTRVLQPGAILTRLERRLPFLAGTAGDAPHRQRTLRDTIAWSYDLLDLSVQRTFRTLSVFPGGFSLGAAAMAEGISEPEALDRISSLIDSSLLQTDGSRSGEPRFRMLETIREYALEQLEEHGETADAHRRYLAWCEELGIRVWDVFDRRRFAMIEDDLDNLRYAFVWSVQHGYLEHALSLSFTLGVHWFLLGAPNTDAIDSLTDHIDRAWPGGDFVQMAHQLSEEMLNGRFDTMSNALLGVAWMAIIRRDLQRALRIAEFVLGQHIVDGLTSWIGAAHCFAGIIATDMGDRSRAVHHLRSALPVLREANDQIWTAHVQYVLGQNLYHLGDCESAEPYLTVARARFHEHQQGWAEAGPLSYLARIARDRDDLRSALDLHQQALRLRARFGDRIAAASSIRSISEIARRDGQSETATRLLAAATALRGNKRIVSVHGAARDEQAVAGLRATLGIELFERTWLGGAALSFEAAVDVANQLTLTESPAARTPVTAALPEPLTRREHEVLRLLAQGFTQPEIAEQLFISPRTVSTHATNIYGKLGVRTQSAAIAFAYQHRLVAVPSREDRRKSP